jgi:hypothetical protein
MSVSDWADTGKGVIAIRHTAALAASTHVFGARRRRFCNPRGFRPDDTFHPPFRPSRKIQQIETLATAAAARAEQRAGLMELKQLWLMSG